MAKITAEQRLRKKNELDDVVLSIFWEYGWNAISYASVAKRYGCSRGAIQRYYPSHDDFSQALKGKVLPLILQNLDWSSSQKFYRSWIEQLNGEDQKFRRVMELLFNNALQEQPSEMTKSGVNRLLQMIESTFEDKELGKLLFGETFLELLNRKVNISSQNNE